MASPVAVPNVMLPNTLAKSDDVNENYAAIVSWINANAMQRDGSINFTGIPTLPATNPTLANQAVRKAYVDAFVAQTANIADLAVTTGKIANNAVTSAKIAANAVTDTEIASSVGSSSIVNGSLVRRDSNGRASIQTPISSAHIANKTYVDFDAGTHLIETGTLMRRDSNGRSNIQTPTIGSHVANKSYVDSLLVPEIYDQGNLRIMKIGQAVHIWCTGFIPVATTLIPSAARPSVNVEVNYNSSLGTNGTVTILTNGNLSAGAANITFAVTYRRP